jgi:hypothetical protein
MNKKRPKQIKISSLFSTVVANYHSTNIYSQGSPDLIFDFCSQYWNGKEVCDLNKIQKYKFMLDFQNQTIHNIN